MMLLNKPISSFFFEDIFAFCNTNEHEDLQLDYKADLTTGSLSKHFASFSNTRGGIIIIGVEEDKTTGLPINFEGIAENAQDIERIHQWANNVSPLPKYKVHPTDSKNGKRFILIRIYEGDDTPYYIQNDGRVWIRTGNISKDLIEIASPDYANLLYKKRESAIKARTYFLNRADDVLSAYLSRYNHIASNGGEEPTPTSAYKLRDHFATARRILDITIQPNYPIDQLTEPNKLSEELRMYQSRGHSFDEFPSLEHVAIPEGIASSFLHDLDEKTYSCEQVYAQGLISYTTSVGTFNHQDGEKIYLDYLVGKIFVVLSSAQRFYDHFGYQGTLKGAISFKRAQGAKLLPFYDGFNIGGIQILLHNYEWDVDTDTRILLDKDGFLNYFLSLCEKIYWDFGFKQFHKKSILRFMEQARLIPKK